VLAGWRNKVDIITAIVGILLGTLICFLNLVYSNSYMITIGPMLVILCLLYLLFRKVLLKKRENTPGVIFSNRALDSIFWFLFAGSILSLSTEVLHRPLAYFVLVALSAAVLAVQVLSGKGKSIPYLLFKILLVSLSVRASAYWVFPTLPGSDTWAHLVYLKHYIAEGHIPETLPAGTGISYLKYPVMHLYMVSMKLITGLDYKEAMFLSVGIPALFSTVFVYLIGKTVAGERMGLLAALLINIADYQIDKSIQPTATGFNLLFFGMVIFLIIKQRQNPRGSTIALIIITFAVMVATHTMSTFVMFSFILFLFMGDYLYKFIYGEKEGLEKSAITPTLVILFAVMLVSYWLYTEYSFGRTFLEMVVQGLYNALIQRFGFLNRTNDVSNISSNWFAIINMTGFLMLYAAGIIGSLLWLSRENRNRLRVTFIVVIILLNAVTFAFPVFGMRNIMPYRWFTFIYIPLSMAASFGITSVVSCIKADVARISVITGTFFIISFLMITNSATNKDSPVYSAGLIERLVYAETEMAVAEKVNEIYDGRIITDYQYGSRVLWTYQERKVNYEMPDEEVLSTGIVIWRDVMAVRPVQFYRKYEVFSEDGEQSIETVRVLEVLGEKYDRELAESHNLIYANNSSRAYLPRGI